MILPWLEMMFGAQQFNRDVFFEGSKNSGISEQARAALHKVMEHRPELKISM
jgi:hypothetical protein